MITKIEEVNSFGKKINIIFTEYLCRKKKKIKHVKKDLPYFISIDDDDNI